MVRTGLVTKAPLLLEMLLRGSIGPVSKQAQAGVSPALVQQRGQDGGLGEQEEAPCPPC